MADPFSISTGVLAVVSFAAKVFKTVTSFGLDWKDAPEEVRRFQTELQALRVTLSDLLKRLILEFDDAFDDGRSLLLAELGPHAPPDSITNRMLKMCQNELSDLLTELNKTSGGGPMGWRRLKHAFLSKRLQDAVAALRRQCDVLNGIISADAAVLQARTNKAVNEFRKEQREWHQETANKEILDWLSATNYSTQLSYSLDRKEQGTAQWLLDSSEFSKWADEAGQILFCQGIPGAGKTMMLSIVVDHLYSKYDKDRSVGIAYLYCDFARKKDQTTHRLLANLLRQLVQRQRSMPDELSVLYDRYKDRQSGPSLHDLTNLLHAIIGHYSRTFILVDALDESQSSDGSHRSLFSNLAQLSTKAGASLMVTSRVNPDIRRAFGDCVDVEIRATNEDIQTYVDNLSLRSRISRDPDLQELVRKAVVEASDGMFLLAELHMRTVMEKFTPGDIEDALKDLPRGEKGLDETYHQAMQRIENHKATEGHAKKVLSWVIYAKRRLTSLELRHAFAVKEGLPGLNEKYIPELEDLISLCGGLITVDQGSDVVRLVHYTTQEFFQRYGHIWFGGAHDHLALTCITYMSFDIFDQGFCLSDADFKIRLDSNPLYHYACRSWGFHVRPLTAKLQQVLLQLFGSDAKLSAATQALVAARGYQDYSQRVPRLVTGVHLAAYFGLDELVRVLLELGYPPDQRDSDGQTPFLWAARRGHNNVLRHLLGRDDVEKNQRDRRGRTALSWAAGHGHEETLQLLLGNGADIDDKDDNGWTALQHAIWNSQGGAVQILLQHGADALGKDKNGWSALHRAADCGREEIVRLILDPCVRGGRPAESSPNYERAPLTERIAADLVIHGVFSVLHTAITTGNQEAVRLLVKNGANIEMPKQSGMTALLHAAYSGSEPIIQFLLEQGADVGAKDSRGYTALHFVALTGKSTGLELLLKYGSDVGAKANDGQTPLHSAAGVGNEAVVRLLSSPELRGVDVNGKDGKGLTPISYAAVRGQSGVVQYLLQHTTVNPEIRDDKGRTALLCAASGRVDQARSHEPDGLVTAAAVLLERDDVNANPRDFRNKTPLICAAQHGHEALVRLLLRRGVDLDAKDIYHGTALFYAALFGYEDVARLLLENGARVNNDIELRAAARNKHKSLVDLLLRHVDTQWKSEKFMATAQIFGAAAAGDVEAVRSLLEMGADLNATTNDRSTPLYLAVDGGHEDVVRLLLQRGADPNGPPGLRKCPLRVASSAGIARLLLDAGVDVETHGREALYCAASYGNLEIVRLMLDHGVDAYEESGSTALHKASRCPHSEDMVKLLLDRGANTGAKDRTGITALHVAAYNHLAVARLLIEGGANIEAKDDEGHTPLYFAASRGYVDSVRQFLELGADPNNVDIETMMPMTWDAGSNTRADCLMAMQLIREARLLS